MKTGASLDAKELVLALVAELKASIKKSNDKEFEKYPFVLLRTRDDLLVMERNYGYRPSIQKYCKPLRFGVTEMPLMPDIEIREYKFQGNYAQHMDIKVPVYEEI